MSCNIPNIVHSICQDQELSYIYGSHFFVTLKKDTWDWNKKKQKLCRGVCFWSKIMLWNLLLVKVMNQLLLELHPNQISISSSFQRGMMMMMMIKRQFWWPRQGWWQCINDDDAEKNPVSISSDQCRVCAHP